MLPDNLSELIRGFQASRVLLTGIELDVFTAIGDGAGADEVARRCETEPGPTAVLLDALAALGLLVKEDGRYRNTEAAARYFDDRSPDSQRLASMHTVNMWNHWARLTDCLRNRGATVSERRESRAQDEGWTEAFIAAMARNAAQRASLLVEAVDASRVRRMLDVGGGPGSYSIAFAKANPDLRAVVADKPEVIEISRRHIEEARLFDRVETAARDITVDPLGSDFDMVLVSNICHMFSPEQNLDLLRRCGEALNPGGRLVIQEFVLNEDRTGPAPAALFAINMLVATMEGNSYRESEYRSWMEAAGFTDVIRVPLNGPSELMVGTWKGR